MAVRQVISGEFQDAQGNPLALGTVVCEASGDAQLSLSSGELCAGIKVALQLDGTGSVSLASNQSLWPTDQMVPSNITYTVWVYSANGQLVWGPNYGLTVPSGTGASGNLASAANYAILAAAGITNTGLTVVTGGVIGSFPTTTISFDGGTATVDNVHAAQAQADALIAYNAFSALVFTSLSGSSANLSVLGNGANASTYVPGNYSAGSSMDIPTTITLDALGNPNAVFIFKAGSTLTLESGASVLLVNGAQASNVIWLVGSSFTSVATSNMVGNIMAATSITLGGGTLAGRALAGIVNVSGAVTISAANSITVPGNGGPFDLDTWIPNQIGSASGASAGSLILQVNGVNNGSQSILDLIAGAGISITDNGVGGITISATGGSSSNGPRSRGWRGWTTSGVAGIQPSIGVGCVPSQTLAGGAGNIAINPTATETSMTGITTSASAGSVSFLDWSGGNDFNSLSLGNLSLAETRMKLGGLTTIRCWIGLGVSFGNFYKSDTPAVATVAFRYSTAAGDAHWKCVVTDGTTQVVADSGVTPDTLGHIFAIKPSGTNMLFFIDGVQVASVSISTTALSGTSLFNGFFSVDNVGTANNVSAAIAYYYWDTTP